MSIVKYKSTMIFLATEHPHQVPGPRDHSRVVDGQTGFVLVEVSVGLVEHVEAEE